MAIPPLDNNGLLPAGVHDCSWLDVRHTFCWNAHRVSLMDSAQDFMTKVWRPLGLALPFWVDGSFTRKKDMPEDIDLVVEADSLDDIAIAPVVQVFLNRDAYKQQFHVDFWVRHPWFPNDLCTFFQYTGTKAGAELQLDSKHVKGILRVIP